MVMFIFTMVLMVSLATVLYLVAQALPRVDEGTEAAEIKHGQGWWARSHAAERIDAAIDSFLLKFLRKAKVTILRVDNTLSAHMERKVKAGSNGKKPAIDFKEIAGQNKNGDASESQ